MMVPLRKEYLKQYLRAIAIALKLSILVIIPICTLTLGVNLVHEGHELLGGVLLAVFIVATFWLGYQAMFMIDYMEELEDDDD